MYANIWQKLFEKHQQKKKLKPEVLNRETKYHKSNQKNLTKTKKGKTFMKGPKGESKRNPKNKTNVAGVCGPIKK